MTDLSDNQFEEAFPNENKRLIEAIEGVVLEPQLSRPEKAEEVMRLAREYQEYARNTEKTL